MARARRRPSRDRRTHFHRLSAEAAAPPAQVRYGRTLHTLACTGAIVAVLGPAHAITLGDITVHSSLGQPLDATVPVRLAAGEYLGATCVSVPPASAADLGAISKARVESPERATPGTYDLRITTQRPLYEPMYELQLQVRCPGTPLLVRHYVLMLDLPGTLPELLTAAAPAPPAAAAAPASAPTVARSAPTRPVRSSSLVAPQESIQPGTRYKVRKGDTLSGISARVRNRGTGIWSFAERILAANPEAFVGGDPDRIKLGAEIDIPVIGHSAAPAPAAATANEATAAAALPAMALPTATPSPAPSMAAAVADSELSVATDDPAAGASASAPARHRNIASEETPARAAGPIAPAAGGDNTWLAAGLGILVGLGLSLTLLRRRLADVIGDWRMRRAARGTTVLSERASGKAETIPAPTVVQVAPRTAPSEPAMVVVEERSAETVETPLLAEPTARTTALTAVAEAQTGSAVEDDPDLMRLFDEDHALALPDTVEVETGHTTTGLDLDLTGAVADSRTAEQPGWGDSDTQLAPTQQAPVARSAIADTGGALDLQALASSADGDEKLSQTLMEALTLLERDYEEELTASQIVDLSPLRQSPTGGDEDTLARTGTGPRQRR